MVDFPDKVLQNKFFGCRKVSVEAVSLSTSPPQHQFCTYNSRNTLSIQDEAFPSWGCPQWWTGSLNVTSVWSTSPPAPSPDLTWTSPIQPGQSSRRCLCRTCRRLTRYYWMEVERSVLVTCWGGWLPLVRGKQLSSSFLTHHPHHLLQTKVTWRAEEVLLGGNGEVHLSWDVTYIQHPRQSGPPGSRSEPWPSRWSPPA